MLLFILNIISYDIWFYMFHRILHTSYLYKYHLKHHTIKNPHWYDTYYATIFENSILGLGIFIPMIYYQVFNYECLLAILFINIRGLIRHETRLKHIFGTHHLLHHKHLKYNYGEYWIDYIMNTIKTN
jgi:Delta7-sterol 5-desaturase